MYINYKNAGTWKINNAGQGYAGEIYIDEEKGLIILSIHISHSGGPLSYLELPYHIPFVVGELSNCAQLSLIDCQRIRTETILGSGDTFVYQVKYLVNGYTFDCEDDIVFDSFKVKFSNLFDWSQISCLTNRKIENDYVIAYNDVDTITLYSSEKVKISYQISSNFITDFMNEITELKQIPYIVLESQSAQPLEFFQNYIIQIKSLIEIGIGQKVDITKTIAEISKCNIEVDDRTTHHNFEIIQNYQKSKKYSKINLHELLFSLNDFKEKDLSTWFNGYEEMQPVIELFVEDLTNHHLSLERRFLNIVQALEVYHGRKRFHGSNRAEYRKYINNKLMNSNQEAIKQYLLCGDNSKSKPNFVLLKERLYDLFIGDYNFFFNTRGLTQEKMDFPKKVADTRNYLTHYDLKSKDKAFEGNELKKSYEILQLILLYYILIEIGFDNEFIHDKIMSLQRDYEDHDSFMSM
ncbi:MAG: HEPN domain-containing protein [Anaerofustis sp.]